MLSLRGQNGTRKYLTPYERQLFIGACQSHSPSARTFCLLIAYTGCRISEALEITAERIDLTEKVVVFRTLKKRSTSIYRAVPLSNDFLHDVVKVHNLHNVAPTSRLWPWCRGTGWLRVKESMQRAGIEGMCASPKGLRHAFGIAASQKGVPLNLIQRWLGHSRIETTAIYLEAMGEEEREFARHLWQSRH